MRGRPLVLLAGVLAVVGVAAACGADGGRPAGATKSPTTAQQSSSTNRPEGDESEPSRSVPGRVATRCDVSHLRPHITMRDSGAGQRHAWLVLSNTSKTTCTVYGYGGMQLYDEQRGEVPTRMVRDRSATPKTLAVAPGRSVRSALTWSTVAGEGDETSGPCQRVAEVAKVTPPDETHTRGVRWSFGPVCDRGKIVQQPYRGKELGPGQ
ncbi:MAG: DUF4232 domain-containing protein [Streptosporangiales bacterium]|nr:DUF4232 domain-containing protein [Streptosporangiales bacterium]